MESKLYNHVSPKVSALELQMIKHIPSGGNWKNLPESIPSKRLEQIRKSGGRTTYYGRLRYDMPSYTITTYFHRIGNGCNIHPEQDRMLSIREAARLQSFSDKFIFYGPKNSQYKQIGNAVPPLLARAIAELISQHLKNYSTIDLFAGAGGMSQGFVFQGFKISGAIEMENYYFETYLRNHSTPENLKTFFILGDINDPAKKKKLIEIRDSEDIGVVIGGPPCQGFSLAGWRNEADERNLLFKNFVELVRNIEPEIFIMENVPGILSMRKGDAVNEIVKSFEEIGYFVNDPILLKAEEFGVPQKRRRVFIIGSKNKMRLRSPNPLFAKNSLELPPFITVRDAIFGLPIINNSDGKYEMEYDGKCHSPYQELLAGRINFTEFYRRCKEKATSRNLITSISSPRFQTNS